MGPPRSPSPRERGESPPPAERGVRSPRTGSAKSRGPGLVGGKVERKEPTPQRARPLPETQKATDDAAPAPEEPSVFGGALSYLTGSEVTPPSGDATQVEFGDELDNAKDEPIAGSAADPAALIRWRWLRAASTGHCKAG